MSYYCAHCGNSLNSSYDDNGRQVVDDRCARCGACSQPLADAALAAVKVQAEMFGSALSALGAGTNVLVVQLLSRWWDGLKDHERAAVGRALFERAVALVEQGQFDGAIHSVIGAPVEALLEPLVADNPRVGEALASRALAAIDADIDADRDSNYALRLPLSAAVEEAVKQITTRHLNERSTVLEQLVRDRMPDLEQLADDAVREITKEAIENVKGRVLRG